VIHTKSMAGLVLAATVVGGLTLSTMAQARELKYAIGHPPGSYVETAAQEYAKRVAKYSNGKLTVRVFPMTLLNQAEASNGVRDGIADVGFVLTPYHPAEYPHSNVISEASLLLRALDGEVRGKEASAYVGAMAEFIFFNCAECNQEFARQNAVFTGQIGTSSYGLICNKPVTSESSIKGKRFRAGAANWSRWANAMGGTPVTMTGNEMREALGQGVVDCVIMSPPDIHNFGLMDVVKDITMAVPGGVFTTVGYNVNGKVWRSLSNDEKRVMLRAAAEGGAYVPWIYQQKEAEVLEAARKKGVRLHEADPGLVKKTREFVEADRKTMVNYFASKYNVKRGDEMLNTFRQILAKWTKLVQPVSTVEQLGALYWSEIYSKVDVTKHGL